MEVELHRGRFRRLIFLIKDQDGNPVDGAGAVATWRLSRKIEGPHALEKAGVVDEDPDETTMRVTVTLDGDDTRNLPPAQYQYELGVTDAQGRRFVVAQGTFRLQGTNIPPATE